MVHSGRSAHDRSPARGVANRALELLGKQQDMCESNMALATRIY